MNQAPRKITIEVGVDCAEAVKSLGALADAMRRAAGALDEAIAALPRRSRWQRFRTWLNAAPNRPAVVCAWLIAVPSAIVVMIWIART